MSVLPLLLTLLVFVISLVVVAKGGDLFAEGAENLALSLGVSRALIGLTVVSFATTSPELSVSLIASVQKSPGIVLGNIIGSCIANIGLILGLSAITRPLRVDRRSAKRDGWVMLGFGGILLILILRGRIDWVSSLALITAFSAYLGIAVRAEYVAGRSRRFWFWSKREGPQISRGRILLDFVVGAVMVVLGSWGLVQSGVRIARTLAIPEFVIGLTIISVGTSLPELVTAATTTRKRREEISIGNVVGANIMNLTWVLGLAAVARTILVRVDVGVTYSAIMLVMMALLMVFMNRGLTIYRTEGAALFVAYALYVAYIALRPEAIGNGLELS